MSSGPSQDITFFLITTGLNVDPKSGSIGYDNYEKIKRVIERNSEILYEAPEVRHSRHKVIDSYLNHY